MGSGGGGFTQCLVIIILIKLCLINCVCVVDAGGSAGTERPSATPPVCRPSRNCQWRTTSPWFTSSIRSN